MDFAELHRISVADFDRRMDALEEEHLHLPTPCTEWDVRTLINHVVYEDRWCVPLLAGATLEEVGTRFDGDLLGDDPKKAWKEARDEALAAVGEPGALERIVNVSWGQISAVDYVNQLTLDHAIHGWDLARGIGADETIDERVLRPIYDYVSANEELVRGSGVFGDRQEVGNDADLQAKVLAILGRRA